LVVLVFDKTVAKELPFLRSSDNELSGLYFGRSNSYKSCKAAMISIREKITPITQTEVAITSRFCERELRVDRSILRDAFFGMQYGYSLSPRA
jgi:hypothetical protein